MLSGSDPFATLGVSPGVTRADLTRAFRTMARITHPDKGGDPERFKAVTEAYDAARRIVARGDDVAGTRASEPRERYDWRRGRSSFETRGESAGARGGEPNRCDDAGVSGDAARPRGGGRADRGDADDADARSGPTSACSSACSSSEDEDNEDDEDDEDDGASERAKPTKRDVHAPFAVLSPRAAPDGRKRPAVSVVCSPDGVVAAACLEAGVHVWDAAKGALLAEHVLAGAAEGEGESPPEAEAPTGDGAASDGNETKKQKTTSFPRASDAWWVLDGRSLLVAYDEGSVLFWGDLLRDASVTSSCPSGGVFFRRDCKNSREKQSAPTPKRPETLDVSSPLSLRGHRRRVVASAWFADPNEDAADVLVTASLDSTARVWRFSKEVEVVQGVESSARTDETDETDASAAPMTKTKTKTKTKRRLLSCTILPGDDSREESAGVTCCAVTADGAFLAAGDSDGVFSVWALSQAAPFATLAQRVRWAGRDASSRVDDAVLKCAFVDVPGNDVGGSRARSSRVERERDGYRLVTAHYSRDADQSRLLVWRVGRRKNVSLKEKTEKNAQRENPRDDDNDAEKRAAARFSLPGAFLNTANDTSTYPTFTARTDRAFHDHHEIRGYEQCVPANGRVWRGRVADVTFSADYASRGGARTLVACGAAGWVTVIEVASMTGGSATFQTMYTTQNPRDVGNRRARLVAPSIRSEYSNEYSSLERENAAEKRALVAVAGEDGAVVARDAEDGEEVARFAVGGQGAKNTCSRVWSLSGFASRRDGTQFLVAGTADGDVACWKVPDHLFSFT